MTERGMKYLSDILQAIKLIDEFTASITTYQEYLNDLKTRSAVERQLGIIGEAVNKFNPLYPELILENSAKIVGLRNRLIHAYDGIDSTIIWAIIKRQLKPLRKEVIQKMKEIDK